MSAQIENTFVRPNGDPATYSEVLKHVDRRITEASRKGRGLRLSACEVRALDFAVLREEGGIETDAWLEGHCTAGNAND